LCSFETETPQHASLSADLAAAEMLRRSVLLLAAILIAVAHSPLAYASEAEHKVPLHPNPRSEHSLGWIR
jgi:hypothetical protein